MRRAWVLDKQGHASHPGRHYLKLIDPGTVFKKLQARVCERLNVTREDLHGTSQLRSLCFARHVLAWHCVKEGLSQAEVGRFMGGRSRASICYGLAALEKRMEGSSEIRALVEGVT